MSKAAAVVMHSVMRLRPLPARKALFGGGIVVAYMNAVGRGTDAPYAH
ncbi:hypothetical protein ACWCPS_39005 [Streptomyces mauvecolor]